MRYLIRLFCVCIYTYVNAQTSHLVIENSFGGSDIEHAFSIQQTKDGGYIACGWTRSNNGDVKGNHGNYDFWVLKLDSAGALKWQQSLGGSNADLAYSIDQTKDNGYIVAGGTTSNDGQVTGLHGGAKEDFWVVKLNESGAIQWQQALGGTEYEEARSIDQMKNGDYIVAGWSGFSSPNNGDVTGNHGSYDFWIVKLSENAQIASVQDLPTVKNLDFKLSPNPSVSFIDLDINSGLPTVLMCVTNNRGDIVFEENISINKKLQLRLNVDNFHSGIYYVSLSSGKEIISRQFLKE